MSAAASAASAGVLRRGQGAVGDYQQPVAGAVKATGAVRVEDRSGREPEYPERRDGTRHHSSAPHAAKRPLVRAA